nr:hypothetical protein [Nocardia wallacei]
MSDESTQLSVAELLARNGQGVPASGGGRRRRSGRGISVTDLTGDMPAVREGTSAHAAPEPETPEPAPGYSAALPDTGPSDSPLSGPISYYDPLGSESNGYGAGSGYDLNGLGTSGSGSSGYEPNGSGSNGYGATGSGSNGYGATGSGSNGYAPPGYGANGSGGNDYGYGANGSGGSGYAPGGFGANGSGYEPGANGNGYQPNGSNGYDPSANGANGYGTGNNAYGLNGSGPTGTGYDLNGSGGAGSNGYGLNGSGADGAGSNGYGPSGSGPTGASGSGYGPNGLGANGFGEPNGYSGAGSSGYDRNGFGANGAGPSAVTPPGFEPAAYEPPAFEAHSYRSPAMSDAALRDPTGFGWPGSGSDASTATPEADPFPPSTRGGRRARRERMEALEALSEQQAAPELPDHGLPAAEGGRRRRREPDIEATEVRPFGGGPFRPVENAAPTAWALQRTPEPEPFAPPFRAPDPADRAEAPPRPQLPRRNRDGNAPAALPAWSARRRTPADAPPDQPARNGAPPPPDGDPTAVWSAADPDQQLVSGSTVAGDLLRDRAERGERPARGNRRAGRAGAAGLLEVPDDRTDVYMPVEPDEFDPDDEFDSDYDPDIDEDEDLDKPARPWAERANRLAARSRALVAARTTGTRSGGARAARKSPDEVARQQWMVLGGQVAGAAVAGMLLFKGFEKMWDVLPFVALTLAMVVILGLVALVRVLRRTDDIMSTVIAVIVGIFVTLGPLAFLLSTN